MRVSAVSLWIGLACACGTTDGLMGYPYRDVAMDPRADPLDDPAPDPMIDPPSDPAVEDASLDQGPFTFVIVNGHSETLYVDWSADSRRAVLGGRLLDEGFEEFWWFYPECAIRCDEIPAGECGCIECEPTLPVALELGPGERVEIEWDGPDVFRYGTDACGCPCVLSEPLARADLGPHYVISGVMGYTGYACYGCTPDEDGVIRGASPDGETHCALADSWLPIEGEVVLVLGGAECWEVWF